MQTGVARKPIEDIEAYKRNLSARLDPTASFLQDVFARITPEQKRVVFTEGEEEVSIRGRSPFAMPAMASRFCWDAKHVLNSVSRKWVWKAA